MRAPEEDTQLTPAERAGLRLMLKDHERATVVWDFFVWAITMIAKIAAAATPIIAVWKFWLEDYFLKKGSIP